MQHLDSLLEETTSKSIFALKSVKELITLIRTTSRSAIKKTILMKNARVTFEIIKELLTLAKI